MKQDIPADPREMEQLAALTIALLRSTRGLELSYDVKSVFALDDWINRHRALGKKPIMASGVWTWPVFWYNHAKTIATAGPCVQACAAERLDEIIFNQKRIASRQGCGASDMSDAPDR